METMHEIPLLLKKINDRMYAKANADLGASNMTFSQMHVLIFLANEPQHEAALKDLEKQFQVAQPTMAGIVNRLALKEFVETLPKPGDRSAKIVHLTSKGEAFMKQHREDMKRNDEKLFRGMSEEDCQELFRLLSLLYEAVISDTQDLPGRALAEDGRTGGRNG